MCVQFLGKFARRLDENDVGSNVDKIELELMKACKEAKGKDERFVREKKILVEEAIHYFFLMLP